MPLSLPDSPRKLVFRALVALFQEDPVLKRTIRPESWFVWQGRPNDNAPFEAPGLMPVAVLTPLALPASPETEASQNSPLGIQLTIAMTGLNVDDLLDLWSAFESVVFTGDGVKTATAALQAALTDSESSAVLNASVQTIRLGLPAIQPVAELLDERMMVATGTLFVQMLVRK